MPRQPLVDGCKAARARAKNHRMTAVCGIYERGQDVRVLASWRKRRSGTVSKACSQIDEAGMPLAPQTDAIVLTRVPAQPLGFRRLTLS